MSSGSMTNRPRFVFVPAASVKLQVDGACGYELSDETAALLAEDVSYRLREVTQVVHDIMTWKQEHTLTYCRLEV